MFSSSWVRCSIKANTSHVQCYVVRIASKKLKISHVKDPQSDNIDLNTTLDHSSTYAPKQNNSFRSLGQVSLRSLTNCVSTFDLRPTLQNKPLALRSVSQISLRSLTKLRFASAYLRPIAPPKQNNNLRSDCKSN